MDAWRNLSTGWRLFVATAVLSLMLSLSRYWYPEAAHWLMVGYLGAVLGLCTVAAVNSAQSIRAQQRADQIPPEAL